ncbi:MULTISPECIES: YsnF/AvaK domain-containing protein [unclassified Psychrobacter]|uniref:YsnF/AvaK domain-containing protein n=1 Tax=unclassified Psychrobacter TaxID=196806 RepID=UPI0018F49885|nr:MULTISPECIES: YsnF/AvaK domain-containing protein [unclassified Psychrobacter]
MSIDYNDPKNRPLNPKIDDTNTAKISNHNHENQLPPLEKDNDSHIDTAIDHHKVEEDFIGRLELLEERPVVTKERIDVGKVTVTKYTRTKSITVPIELVEEYLTIRTDYNDTDSQELLSGSYDDKDIVRHVTPSLGSKAVVTINGKEVDISDEPLEIVLSRQVANITKDTYAVQEVSVSKTTHTHTDSIQVELQHEALDVQEEGLVEVTHHPNSDNH